jgi:hypothetical protein
MLFKQERLFPKSAEMTGLAHRSCRLEKNGKLLVNENANPQRQQGRERPLLALRAGFLLVPKLCLGTLFARLCFASMSHVGERDAKRSFADGVPNTEFGNQENPRWRCGMASRG